MGAADSTGDDGGEDTVGTEEAEEGVSEVVRVGERDRRLERVRNGRGCW